MTFEEARYRLFTPRVYPFVVLLLVGLVVGTFYVFGFSPNLRWIKLFIGVSVVSAMVFTRLSVGIGLFLVASLFPANIVLGPTNFVLIVLMFVSWMARVALAGVPGPQRTPCDLALGGLTLAYVVSWSNVTRDAFHMQQAWWYTQNQLGALMIFYMTYAAVESARDARILVRSLQVMAFIVYGTAVLEVITGVSITGLGKIGEAQYRLGGGIVRAGGLLGSHDMLADFCSMNMPLHLYFVYRARRALERLFFIVLVILGVLVLFMTSNRGGLIGFFSGLLYLLFLIRQQMAVGLFVTVIGAAAALIVMMNALLSKAGRTLSVFQRFATTKFYGLLPETRVGVFEHFKLRVAEHPILGEGPYYRLSLPDPHVPVFWPHNAFAYYWVTVGMLGLLSFIVLTAQVLVLTWRARARVVGQDTVRDLVLFLHVMVAVLLITQQRTDFQRGFVFTYYVFFVFGLAMGLWKLATRRAGPDGAATGGSAAG